MADQLHSRDAIAFVVKWLRVVVWAAVLVVSIAWYGLMPAGFPLMHLRFLANTAIPVFLAVASLVGIFTVLKPLPRFVVPMMAVPLAVCSAGSVSFRVLFPLSCGSLWLVGIGAAIALSPLAFIGVSTRKNAWSLLGIGGGVGLLIGFLMARAQQAEAPSTRPRNAPIPVIPAPADSELDPVNLTDSLRVGLRSGRVWVSCHGLSIELDPVMTFISRSPDRCWSILAPKTDREGEGRRLAGVAIGDRSLSLAYEGSEQSFLEVAAISPVSASINGRIRLSEDVYSHLNYWCAFTVRGHRKLSLSFSPCPDKRFEVLPHDYPVGRPIRFAYVDLDGCFRVAEASTGEKGPYSVLTSGYVEPTEALVITLHDDGRPVARLTFEDWFAQAGLSLSPTAGWGLPVNAIEFMRNGEAQEASCSVYLCLAATSVGRGWDTVGHAAGVYSNRVKIEPVGD